MTIASEILKIKEIIPDYVKLVAVSKTKPEELILEAYNAGHRVFGENRSQELAKKYNNLPKDIEWHMIGHLQTNKVKYIAPFVSLIHSVDSIKLLEEIDKEAIKNKRIINCLLQVKIALEDTKFGLSLTDIQNLLGSDEFKEFKHIRVAGLMGMATFTNDEHIIREEFKKCKFIFDKLKNDFFNGETSFSEISMGMSDDYKIAIEEGSTLIRIGSLIFGERDYP